MEGVSAHSRERSRMASGPLLQTITGTRGGKAQRASVTGTMLAATLGSLPPREAGLPWNHGKC